MTEGFALSRLAGQKRVNVIWELTQAFVAISVTLVTLYVSAKLALSSEEPMLLLSNAFFLVIGFYFGRTNHNRTGGVGGDEVIGNR